MSKRPTFAKLIVDYAQAEVEVATLNDDDPTLANSAERARTAYDRLTRALRKAGIPLDAEAPQ